MSCLTAAHPHQIAIRAEIACAHLGAGLKSAAAADDGAAEKIVFAVRRQDADALDVVLVAVEGGDLGLVADLNAQLAGDLAPEQQLPEPAADGVNDRAGLEIHLAVHRNGLLVLEVDPGLAHPMDGRIGIVDQERCKLLIDAAFGDAIEVGEEVVARVGRHHEGIEFCIIDIDELPDFPATVVDEAEAGVGIARIAAEFAFRRLFQHDDALGAALTRGHGGFVRRAPAADDNDIAGLLADHQLPRTLSVIDDGRQATTDSFFFVSAPSSEPKPATEMSKLLPSGSVARVSA